MRQFFLVLFTLFTVTAWAQDTTVVPVARLVKHAPYELKSTIASLSVGFVDNYKQSYSLPEGYTKGNTTGFAPIYAKLEYAVGRHISIAGTFSYDAFNYNFNQLYTGNSGAFTRSKTDAIRILSGGVMGYYHFGSMLHVKALDPFVGVGVSLSNLRHSATPQGDTSVTQLTHPLNSAIKVGARYYLSQQFSVYGDVGYDHQSIFSLGFSARFFKSNKKKVVHEIDTDGDGIPDRIDSCPTVKGLAAFNGCPDTDGDGIPDDKDGCPTVAGPADNNGCPHDVAPQKAVVAPVKVVAIPKNIIQFEPGTANLKDSSIVVLDSIATVLKNSGRTDVSIESFLAPQAEQAISKKIANARTVAIKKYLVDKGIVATRMAFVKYRDGVAPVAKKKRAVVQLVYDVTQ